MLRRFAATVLALLLAIGVADAQVTVPNTLVAGAVIKAGDLNTNFATLGNHALDRLTGGEISGNITVDPGVTIAGLNLATQLCSTCAATFTSVTAPTLVASNLEHTGDATTEFYFPSAGAAAVQISGVQDWLLNSSGLTVFGNAILNSSGKIPAINSTYFASLSGANLTGVPASSLTGSYPALNGSAITNLTAANLTGANTLPDAVLSTNIPLLNALNTFTAFGKQVFGSSGTGAALVQSKNTAAGMANLAGFDLLNDEAVASAGRLVITSSTYNTAPVNAFDPANVAGAVQLIGPRGGGIVLRASNSGITFQTSGGNGGAISTAGAWTQYETANFSWNAKTAGTIYGPANTDGFVVAIGHTTTNVGELTGISDSSASPTTIVADTNIPTSNNNGSIVFPVRKGDYWKANMTGTGTSMTSLWWVPLGTNP